MNLDFNGGQICRAQYNPGTQKVEEGDLQIQVYLGYITSQTLSKTENGKRQYLLPAQF